MSVVVKFKTEKKRVFEPEVLALSFVEKLKGNRDKLDRKNKLYDIYTTNDLENFLKKVLNQAEGDDFTYDYCDLYDVKKATDKIVLKLIKAQDEKEFPKQEATKEKLVIQKQTVESSWWYPYRDDNGTYTLRTFRGPECVIKNLTKLDLLRIWSVIDCFGEIHSEETVPEMVKCHIQVLNCGTHKLLKEYDCQSNEVPKHGHIINIGNGRNFKISEKYKTNIGYILFVEEW